MSLVTPLGLKPLELKTPVGFQHIYFQQTLDYETLLVDYDKILIVTDKRVRNLPHVNDILFGIHNAHINSYELLIDINNYTKNTELMDVVLSAMNENGLTRKSLLIAIGGGSTADLVGVTASIYMRGIQYAVVPTSFISMADGVISKVAINYRSAKNMVGAFHSPTWILIDASSIDLTNDLHIAYGLVEVWKHALLSCNDEVEMKIRKILAEGVDDISEIASIARWSMEIKAENVLGDWEDRLGFHKALSLGHTLANHLEMKDTLHHAEAVLYGIVFEAILARNLGLLRDESYEEVIKTAKLFEQRFNSLDRIKKILREPAMLEELKKDKISHFGKIRFVLPTDAGYTIKDIDPVDFVSATEEFEQLNLRNESFRSSHDRKVSSELNMLN